MKVRYTKNGEYYVFTNFTTSANPLFISKSDVQNFKKRIQLGLKDICSLIAYRFEKNQYQLVLLLNNREAFETFYEEKQKSKGLECEFIPQSTYILSQEMANIQSGYAKWFNHKYRRYGALFGRRYTKLWLETKEQVLEWIRKLRGKKQYWRYQKEWMKELKPFMKKAERTKVWELWLISDDLQSYLRGPTDNTS